MSAPDAFLTPSEGFITGCEIVARSIAAFFKRGYIHISLPEKKP